jgi:glycosyltransferase involved in cell wall biosynthesis
MNSTHSDMHLLFWGTYDKGKPRVRILIRGLQENSVSFSECHSDVWGDVEDKSQITGFVSRLVHIFRWLSKYPSLIWRFLRLPSHDVVIVPYMGQLDVLVLWPFAKATKTPIVWDAFISLYNTVVEDRKLISRRNPLAKILFFWEWLACKAADVIILDTKAHGDYFVETFTVPIDKVHVVFVGAEPEFFSRDNNKRINDPDNLTILFYGQFIPLHGIETIVRAAQLSRDKNAHWIIIGKGQEEENIRSLLEDKPPDNLTWLPWVSYDELIDWIQKSDICLGIFGDSDKAARVIPNKVFQIIMAGKPLITRDSPAIKELLNADMPGVCLIPPSDPLALVAAVEKLAQLTVTTGFHQEIYKNILPVRIGKQLIKHLETVSTRA